MDELDELEKRLAEIETQANDIIDPKDVEDFWNKRK